MFLCWVNDTDLIEIVRKFKDYRSTDVNSIDMVIIKDVIDSAVSSTSDYICNQSFKKGVFPNSIKLANVIPMFKNGDKHCVDNYRLVSLLPQFSKILETHCKTVGSLYQSIWLIE